MTFIIYLISTDYTVREKFFQIKEVILIYSGKEFI